MSDPTRQPPIDPKTIDAMRRLVEKLPQGDDLTMVVLKGHLLIEERLYDLLGLALDKRPQSLKDGRLRFFHLIHLVKAMAYKPDSDWLWTALEKLNSLRNDLAHHLEPKKLEESARELIDALKTKTELGSWNASDNPAGRLRAAIALLYGLLLGIDRAFRDDTAA